MQHRRFRETFPARAQSWAAAAGALALHLGLAWGLGGLIVTAPARAPQELPDAALQIVWVAPRAMAPPLAALGPRVGPKPLAIARPTTRTRAIAAIDGAAVTAEPTPRPAPPPLPARPLSAALAGQARDWAQQQAPIGFAPQPPLADRIATLPGRPANRFQMPAPLSAADVVGFIGQTFGNGPDPCVSNRADLAAYATGRDARALALAVDFDRRHCRP